MARRNCIFCQQPSGSMEHVFPAWLQTVLGDGKGDHEMIDSDGSVVRAWHKKAFSTTSSHVCHDCNTGWMAQLESTARPLLTPMILGEDYSFNKHQKRIVAAWALKTCATVETTIGASDVARAHRKFLYDNKREPRAPRTVRVVAARYDQGSLMCHYNRAGIAVVPAQSSTTMPERTNAWAATFAVGQMILQVSGHELRHHQLDIGSEDLDPFLVRLWPETESVQGPPPAVSHDSFEVLADAFKSVRVIYG